MNVSALKAPTVTLSQGLADFAVDTEASTIAESARQVMQLSVLDWVAVAIAGKDEPVSRIVRQMVADEGGAAEAGAFGLTARLPARAAAMANGACSHALDYDDTHFAYFGHPTVVCASAAFAVAEKLGVTEAEALDAALIGAEVACRVGRWLGLSHYQQGFHQTATAGTFGAAMAAARLLRLDAEHACHALGIAATRASGLKSQFGTMGKPFHAGMAASNGIEAAALAASGFVSNPDGLDTVQGFSATHAGGEAADPLNGLGRDWLFQSVQHKFHACCHGTHATLEALGDLRREHGLEPDDVAQIAITVHPLFLKVCNIAEPSTGLEAKFSLRLTAAMALAGDDTAMLSSFSDAACVRPELVALRDRAVVDTDADMPEPLARVRITSTAGAVLEASHDINAQLPIETRQARVRRKAGALLGSDRADACWQRIEAMPSSGTAFSLSRLTGADGAG